MSTIATICARGGSKGLPGKNIRPLHGRPLIGYTIEQALQSPSIDEVYVSTDSPAIAEVAVAEGATVLGLRPPHLATDDAPKIPVITHLVESVEASGRSVTRVVDLQPTSPLRSVADIEGALAMLTDDVDVVITGARSEASPYYTMVEEKQPGRFGLVVPPDTEITSRQTAPAVYTMNGSIYCWQRSALAGGLWGGTTAFFEMPRNRSIDIDDEIDWKLVELLFRDGSSE